MKRRELVLALGGAAAAWPRAARAALASEASGQRGDSKVRAPDTRPEPGSSARAQQPAMPVIGYLSVRSAESDVPMLTAFGRGLNETGYAVGRNVIIESRFAGGQ